jgi:hypothetical protein
MTNPEERMHVLKMVQEGKINPEEAMRLLDTLEETSAADNMAASTPPASRQGRRLIVRVTDSDSGKVRVNVRLPIGLVRAGLKMGAKFMPEVEGLDPNQLMELINSGETGMLVDVQDENEGEHVEVFIE